MSELRNRPVARALLYKFLSRVFDYPLEPLPTHIETDVLLAAEACGVRKAFHALLDRVDKMSREKIEEEYIRVLGHVSRNDAPAYETAYGNLHTFQQTAELGDIAAFYRAHGVRAESGERPDHIGPELEFMAFLALKEANDAERAAEARESQKQFMTEHLGRWAMTFAQKLKKVDGPFELAARALEDFLKAECLELGAQPAAYRGIDVSPARFNPEGACFSCDLGENPAQIKPEEMV